MTQVPQFILESADQNESWRKLVSFMTTTNVRNDGSGQDFQLSYANAVYSMYNVYAYDTPSASQENTGI